ncbi:MAG: HNH endonuclease, partial [Hyphomicrobiales bacterium]
MKGIFDTKPNSGYDDQLTRYHFPTNSNYMAAAQAVVGDWVIYREPQRNGGRRAYVAVARVVRIEPDPIRPGHAYAIMADYLPFDTLVPFAGTGRGYWEESLRALTDPIRAGIAVQGKALRVISDGDFAAIVQAGLTETLLPDNAIRVGLGVEEIALAFEHALDPPQVAARRVEQMLVNRKIRDANFRWQVCQAYDNRCAVTGLRIINGGGRAEVQAAHIWSVGEGGPDVV